MAWRCPLCLTFFALTLHILLSHIRREHSTNPNFSITCNVDGCPETYTKFNSFYRHVRRQHTQRLDATDQTNENQINTGEQHYVQEFQQAMPMDVDLNDEDQANTEHDSHNADTDVNQTDAHEEMKDFHSKEIAINYITNLKEFHRVRESTAQQIAISTDTFVQRTVEILQNRVLTSLERAGLRPETIPDLQEHFSNFELPFNGIQTPYERNKFIVKNYLYVEPEEIVLGQQLQPVLRNRQRLLEVVEETYFYIPITKSIEQLLQKKEILEMALERRNPEFDGRFFHNLTDGRVYRQHPLFSTEEHALQILLYFDDIEICNPLGKKSGVHKVGVFYYSLANFPIQCRSRLCLIRLVAIVKRKKLKKYGMNRVLERINEDLNILERGINICVNNNTYNVKGAVLGFVGDTLAAHEFTGFKEGVGFAYQKCRECECTFEDMQINFKEGDFIARSLERYDRQTSEINAAQTAAMRNRLSMAYGINLRSKARDFPHFDIINMVPEDIMHVLFEGVIIYETRLVLSNMFAEGDFTLKQLNRLLENFPYGYKHKECKPNVIPEKVFDNNDTMTLKQSSSSMIVLIRMLPFFLVNKLNADLNSPFLEFITELCELVQIILAPVISIETVQMLKVLISRHCRKFTELFPHNNVIPKQHYLVHLPTTIEKYGPLVHVWSMRFENKHQFLKQKMAGSKNFRNIEKSLAKQFAMYECALNACEKHPLFHNDLVVGKSLRVANLTDTKQKINAFFGTDTNCIDQVYSVSWVIIHGQKFIPNECEIAFGENNGLPEFGHLSYIWVANITLHGIPKQQIYFGLKMYETLRFDYNIQAHIVQHPELAQGHELVDASSIFVPFPLHLYTVGDTMCILVPHDMIDLIKHKRESVYQ